MSSKAAVDWFNQNAAAFISRDASYDRAAGFIKTSLKFMPTMRGNILDIGAGTGSEAILFADAGHRVYAIEPSDNLRNEGIRRYGDRMIWLPDTLPDLHAVKTSGIKFDGVNMTAVLMFIKPEERLLAFQNISALMKTDAHLAVLTKIGWDDPERGAYPVHDTETTEMALRCNLAVRCLAPQPDLHDRPDVQWKGYIFQKYNAA